MQTMCPPHKRVNLYERFSARDGAEREMQAGRWGERGAPHLGLEVAFSTPFRSAEGRTWQREGKHRVSLSSLRRAGGSCRGSGSSHGGNDAAGSWPRGAPHSCLGRGRRGRAGCCWPQLLAPAFPALFIARHVGMLPSFPAAAARSRNLPERGGESLQRTGQREQQGELQPRAPLGLLQAAGHIPAANPAPFSPSQPPPQLVFGGAGSAPRAKPSLARAAGARCQVRLAKQRQPGERMLSSAG